MEVNSSISAIVLAKNSEQLISQCLGLLKWTDEIILIDSGSTDQTNEIARKFGASVYKANGGSFSDWRNLGAEKARGKWLLYVDIDEEITLKLKEEILRITSSKTSSSDEIAAYAIPRRNILLGREMKYGGWWPDYVLRLIKKDCLNKWFGKLHEQPIIIGKIQKLKEPLVHNTHRTLTEMIEKTNIWSEIEAQLLFQSKHPKMVWWRFFSVAFREFWYRAILKFGFLDGVVGVIEIIYQMFSRMITYAKLWELQIVRNKK